MTEPLQTTIGHLLLARLLVVGKAGETEANVKRSLRPVIESRLGAAEWARTLEEALDTLQRAGMVEQTTTGQRASKAQPRYRLTEEGRAEAQGFLDANYFPARMT